MTLAAYAVANDVLEAAGQIGRSLTTAETTAVTNAIAQASNWMERATSSFFNQQHLQIITEPPSYRARRCFLPYPCLSIDPDTVPPTGIGEIVEAGVTLTQNVDFYLYQPQGGGASWMERAASGTVGFTWTGVPNTPQSWSTIQQGIVVKGQFGYATVPPEITKAVAWVAAKMLGWVTVAYQTGDGIQKAVLDLTVPDWVKATISRYKNSHLDEQFFNVTALS